MAGEIPQRFLIGFSKSGNGVLTLILRHPNMFSAAAAWDAPAQLNDHVGVLRSAFELRHAGEFRPVLHSYSGRDQRAGVYPGEPVVDQRGPGLLDGGYDPTGQSDDSGVRSAYLGAGRLRQHSWSSGWLDGAVTALDANATPVAPVDINEQRIIAYGLRSPRLAFRPGTQEIWIADKGWTSSEEINRIPDASDRNRREFRVALL